jgi:hypothetical protein
VKEVLKEKKLTEAQRQQLNIRQLGRRWELTTHQYIPPTRGSNTAPFHIVTELRGWKYGEIIV